MIFISYRRADTKAAVGRLTDHLRAALPDVEIFWDVDSIPAGRDFRVFLEGQVRRASILLAIIGRDWAGRTLSGDPEHPAPPAESIEHRLPDPNDMVRVEIRTALAEQVPVIPVFIDGARFPEQLPEDLQPLRRLNAVNIDNGTAFLTHFSTLVSTIREETFGGVGAVRDLLIKVVNGMTAGDSGTHLMVPDLRLEVAQQWSGVKRELETLGPVEHVVYVGPIMQMQEFHVRHQSGAANWYIAVGADQLIRSIYYVRAQHDETAAVRLK